MATHSIRQFPLHFPSRASPCAITFQLDSTTLTPKCFETCLEKQSTVISFLVKSKYAVILSVIWGVQSYRDLDCGTVGYGAVW
jgi:hypothetical protein